MWNILCIWWLFFLHSISRFVSRAGMEKPQANKTFYFLSRTFSTAMPHRSESISTIYMLRILIINFSSSFFGIYLRDCTKSAFDKIQLLVFRCEREVEAAIATEPLLVVLVVCWTRPKKNQTLTLIWLVDCVIHFEMGYWATGKRLHLAVQHRTKPTHILMNHWNYWARMEQWT